MLFRAFDTSGSAADGETLQLALLGPPIVTWGGAALKIGRRQVRALLFRLAAVGRPVAREQLSFLFWPDVPELAARRSLTTLLGHLQRALPPAIPLVFDSDSAALDMRNVAVDTLAFDRILTGESSRPRAGSLAQAASLHRGPFLDGFSLPGCPEFEAWVTLERQVWERRRLAALAALLEAHAEAGDYGAAISTGLVYLRADEFAEAIHRRLIELHCLIGDRPAALRQYKWCAGVLAAELGVKPSPETEAAYRRALRDGKTLVTQPAAPPVLGPLADAASLPALPGRAAALRRLDDAWRAAANGHGRVVAVSGHFGSGKSRLLDAFVEHLAACGTTRRPLLLLRGAGHADARDTPYGALVEALRPAIASGLSLTHLTECCLAEVARVLPEVTCLYAGVPQPAVVGPAEARTRLFEALYRLLRALIPPTGAGLLCLDDLHEADEVTLDWLAYLGRQLDGMRLLVVVAYASEEGGRLGKLRQGLARARVLEEFPLAPLDEAAIVAVLESLGWPRVRGLVAAPSLRRLSGGNPLLLMETLRALDNDRAADRRIPEDFTALTWPESLSQAVRMIVERASLTARQTLDAAAALSEPFALAAVQQAGGQSALAVQDGLDELVARGLLVATEAGYCFAQAVVRLAVGREISASRRHLLAQRSAAASEF
jgi:DNA-binding SARP family transcriptional activator